MLAAEQTAYETWFCTFTYGGGYENDQAYWLDYADLQRCFKRMRKAGHKFQYVSVGEYGGKGSRAHFHAIIYWQSPPPVRPMGERLNSTGETREEYKCSFWPNGIVQYEFPKSQQAASVYMMDYLDKENLDKNALKYSKNPALGQHYLVEYAKDRAKAGLALFPNGPSYTIPNNSNKNGKPFWYRLDTSSALYERMLQAYLEEWAHLRPGQNLALSEDVIDFMSEVVQDTSKQPIAVQEYLQRRYGYEPVHVPSEEYTVHAINDAITIDDRHNMASIYNEEGKRIWLGHVAEAGDVPKLLTHDQSREIMRQVLRVAPPRVHKHLRSRFPPSTDLGSLLSEEPPPKPKTPVPPFVRGTKNSRIPRRG